MSESTITFAYKVDGRSGKATVSVKSGDTILHIRKCDLSDPGDRDKFARELVEKFPGIEIESVETELLSIADEVVSGIDGGGTPKETQADRLVKLAGGLDLFHAPGGVDGECYATLEADGRRETWPLSSKTIRYYLSGKYHEVYEKTPGSQAIQDALGVLRYEASRREESEIDAKFEERRPRILGALLSAVSGALTRYDSTRLDRKPRMADFARWITAAEPSLGWEQGDFLEAYFVNRAEANTMVIENSIVGPVLMKFVEQEKSWKGTTGDLLKQLTEVGEDKTVNLKDWPKNTQALSGKLRRLAPSLRALGIDIEWDEKRKRRGRLLQLEWVGNTTSPEGTASKPKEYNGLQTRGDVGDELSPTYSKSVSSDPSREQFQL